MKAFYRELGRKVRERRRSISLSQAKLAANVGLSRTSITNIELGRQHVAVHMLYELATALGAEPQHFLPDKKLLRRNKVLRVDRKHLAESVAQTVEDLYQRITTGTQMAERKNDASGKKS